MMVSPEQSSRRVLIVGAGIGGLSLAIALRSRGIKVRIVERAGGWTSHGAGLYLVGNATRALRSLGVSERVIAGGCLVRTQTVFSKNGTRLGESNVEAFWKECGPCLGVRRTRLHGALVDQAAGVDIRFGIEVQSLNQHGAGVSVGCSDGSFEDYDLVVGADGIRSAVRRLEFAGGEPTFREQMGWRFIAPLPSGISGWSAFLGTGRAFLFVPIGDDMAYCYADQSIARPIHEPAAGRLEHLKALFSDFAPPVREALSGIGESDPIHFAPIEQVMQPVSHRGRVVLIGDAAHAMSPNMASGVAMALEDALVLAEVLSASGTVPEAVAEFARRRAARVDWVRRQTDRRDALRMLPAAFRNLVLRLLWARLYVANYRPLLARP